MKIVYTKPEEKCLFVAMTVKKPREKRTRPWELLDLGLLSFSNETTTKATCLSWGNVIAAVIKALPHSEQMRKDLRAAIDAIDICTADKPCERRARPLRDGAADSYCPHCGRKLG